MRTSVINGVGLPAFWLRAALLAGDPDALDRIALKV
ncbi:hypothetical protein XFF4834R_chr24900 [Xanthomonas citri pv. fuscans]|nr:hypothetical protein XFF4834R_chr24900 [Xanthomonas citri pv. fuscans]